MNGRGYGRLEQANPGGRIPHPGRSIERAPVARRCPQENRRPLSRGYRAARWLDRRLSFAQREQAGHDVTEMVPERLDPRDLIAEGDRPATGDPADRSSSDPAAGSPTLAYRQPRASSG
jgi:hypothetical protein